MASGVLSCPPVPDGGSASDCEAPSADVRVRAHLRSARGASTMTSTRAPLALMIRAWAPIPVAFTGIGVSSTETGSPSALWRLMCSTVRPLTRAVSGTYTVVFPPGPISMESWYSPILSRSELEENIDRWTETGSSSRSLATRTPMVPVLLASVTGSDSMIRTLPLVSVTDWSRRDRVWLPSASLSRHAADSRRRIAGRNGSLSSVRMLLNSRTSRRTSLTCSRYGLLSSSSAAAPV